MDSDTEETRSQMTAAKEEKKHKKKRKKVTAEEEEPKNKPEEPETIRATIRMIPANPERIAPVVGYFPSGFDPTKNPDPDSVKVETFRHKQRGGTRLQLVVTPGGKDPKYNFVGTSYAGEAQVGDNCNYGLGILDKATNTLKILPIANNKVKVYSSILLFMLLDTENGPKVRGVDLPGKEHADPGKGEPSKQEMREKLDNMFGTNKANRKNEKEKTLRHEDDPDAEHDLDAFKQGMTNRENTEVSEGHTDRNIPPFDASATTPQEAYSLDKIIATGEWEYLQDVYKILKDGAEIKRDAFPAFVCNRIHKLQLIEDEDKKYKLSCIFSYITHLIKFKDLHSMDGVSSAKHHRFPNIIKDKFSSMFNAVSKRLSTEKSNLLISYVLVLTLFTDEFQTNMADIAKDLRMQGTTLKTHYEALGCKINKKNGASMVTLPVPLKFQTMKRKRRNK